ncbi:glycoside hydrolase family 88 protein [Paenibacillus agricola]|uniref:Uncharacterized protein n=1 Tax=Paenibacillus agricola TaxID=2716264 RepID=A0ABX0J4A0_9BACL|nr:glycoside hydrolase family 88 protein [Paenibacillus agricola]NHN30651.1 hypothetical protein [Paenibacillus agricola]
METVNANLKYVRPASIDAPCIGKRPFDNKPEGKRVPFGWSAVPILQASANESTHIHWVHPEKAAGAWYAQQSFSAFLRITVAVDVREEKIIDVVSAVSGAYLGSFDIKYAYVLQPFEIQLPKEAVEVALKEGVALRMVQGELPLWIFAKLDGDDGMMAGSSKDVSGDGYESGTRGINEAAANLGEANTASADAPDLLQPHVLLTQHEGPHEQRIEALLSALASTASLQTFGWMEGCVLDGLLDLSTAAVGEAERAFYSEAAAFHLQHFFDAQGQLVYENPRSEPVDGHIYGIEGTLPFASVAMLWPAHPSIQMAIDYFYRELKQGGAIMDGSTLSAEGSYTIAYPLAQFAAAWDRKDLAEEAVRQLTVRQKLLVIDDDVYLRWHTNGNRSFRNWARAYAWYMLGLSRSIAVFTDKGATSAIQEVAGSAAFRTLLEEWVRVAGAARRSQQADGCWAVFVGEPETGVDTSGSSGIAAALAIGSRFLRGKLAQETLGTAALAEAQLSQQAAQAAYAALPAYLTPDGLLKGVAQSNRNGEELQRGGYRVLSQMGMGLLGQLHAALHRA